MTDENESFALKAAKAKLARQANIIDNAFTIADISYIDDYAKPENLTAYIDMWDWDRKDVVSIYFGTQYKCGISCNLEIHVKHINRFIIEYLCRLEETNRNEIYKNIEQAVKQLESEF